VLASEIIVLLKEYVQM